MPFRWWCLLARCVIIRGGGATYMTAADVISLYTELQKLSINIWVDGGWGVDALICEQTRPHKDLDIAIQRRDIPQLRALLEARCYKELRIRGCQTMEFCLGR